MKFTEKKKSALMVASAVLWLVIMILGVTGNGSVGLYFTVLLTACYGVFGASLNDTLNKKLLVYPIAVWMVMMIVCIWGMNYYYYLFQGTTPTFTILGFHPSYAFVVLLFWIGAVIAWSVGLYASRKDWLSDKAWEDFLKKIERIDAQEGEK